MVEHSPKVLASEGKKSHHHHDTDVTELLTGGFDADELALLKTGPVRQNLVVLHRHVVTLSPETRATRPVTVHPTIQQRLKVEKGNGCFPPLPKQNRSSYVTSCKVNDHNNLQRNNGTTTVHALRSC